MTEGELDAVVRGQPKKPGLARRLGYLVYHTHRSDGSDPGFPDLVLLKGSRIIYAELKTQGGRVSPAQRDWLEGLQAAGHEVHVWRPSDWFDGGIEEVLRR